MVTGQLTRSEAQQALKRLQGLRDDWGKQRTRWSEHHQKATDIKAHQRNPSAALIYTVEACCNQMGIATLRFNELERLIQDFRSCALYLVHLPVPEGPDASFRSALPDLWSIPHSAPGTAAVALPGQVAGFSSEMAPIQSIQGLSDQIFMGTPSYPNAPNGYFNDSQLMSNGGPGMQFSQQPQQLQAIGFQQQSQQATGYQQQSQPNGGFQNQLTGFQPQPNSYNLTPQNNLMGGLQPMGQFSNQQQPLTPQHTQLLYHQQINLQQQANQQARINSFSNNVFQQQPGFQASSGLTNSTNPLQFSSPLNPFNPNAPHGAVLDASQKYPAVQ